MDQYIVHESDYEYVETPEPDPSNTCYIINETGRVRALNADDSARVSAPALREFRLDANVAIRHDEGPDL